MADGTDISSPSLPSIRLQRSRVTAIERGLMEPFDGTKLTNAGKLPAGSLDKWGVAVNSQIVGIAYNPKKLPKPKSWKDLFQEPYVSRLGLRFVRLLALRGLSTCPKSLCVNSVTAQSACDRQSHEYPSVRKSYQ